MLAFYKTLNPSVMLNPQQMAAVKYLDGPLLVLAGAGSGKTSVITQKIAYLINQCDYQANTISAVTFTNKAANEMRSRITSVLRREQCRGLNIATFHTLGLTILKKNAPDCGLRKGFSIFDSEDSLQLLRHLLPTHQASDKEFLFGIQQLISSWKNELITPEEAFSLPVTNSRFEHALTLYPQYQQALRSYNAVDFDDLIQLPVQLFTQQPSILEYWQNKIRHLLIDEYQDSNRCQYQLVKLLVGVRSQFTVVGDDDQSIYAWRGARPENLSQLQKDYPRLKIIKLEQNYRSTGRILHAANQLISHNAHLFTKKLWSELGPGDPLRVLSCKDEQDEAEQVVADLISHKLRHRTTFGDYAILYRGNHQSRVFEKILRSHSIPYHINAGQSFFARQEVKDILAYLKLLCNESDDAAFLRVINTPKRGIGGSSLAELGEYAQSMNKNLFACCDHLALGSRIQDKPLKALSEFKHWILNLKERMNTHNLVDAIRDMIHGCQYEAYLHEQSDNPMQAQKRMENVWELVDWIQRLLEKSESPQLDTIVNKLILIDLLDQSNDNDKHTLQLMTLHASKGLEFPHVYLVGMEEELLPHKVSIQDEQIEEERRLAYVGITRAQKTLCFTLARQRRREGGLQDCHPSRFLDELPPDHLEWYGKLGQRDEAKSKALAKSHLEGLKNLLV